MLPDSGWFFSSSLPQARLGVKWGVLATENTEGTEGFCVRVVRALGESLFVDRSFLHHTAADGV